MANSSKAASKSLVQRIVDSIKGRPKGGTPDVVPPIDYGHAKIPSADPQVKERSSRYQQKPSDLERDAHNRELRKPIERAYEGEGTYEEKGYRHQRAVFDYQQNRKLTKVGDVDASGRMHGVNEEKGGRGSFAEWTPEQVEAGLAPFADPNKKGTRIFRPQKKTLPPPDFLEKMKKESRDFYASDAGRTPSVSMQKAINDASSKTTQQLASDLSSTKSILGRSIWSQQKDANRK